MNISVIFNNKNIDINEGMKFSDLYSDDDKLNSIFNLIDNGDDIVDKTEINIIKFLFNKYDKNNNGAIESNELEYINEEDMKKDCDAVKIAEQLNKDICTKTNLGFPTTGRHFKEHINNVTTDNVLSILQAYNDITDGEESLFSGIMGEMGLSMDDRMKFVKHIFSKLKEYYESKGVYADDLFTSFENELQKQKESWGPANAKNIDRMVKQLTQRSAERPYTDWQNVAPNGEVDADFQQGTTGDCWLLASIKAIANTPKGLEMLNNSIKVNKDGSVTVTLKGKNKTYTFSKNEIARSSHLSTGDLDVRAIEMAVNKYITEEGGLYFYDDAVDINSNKAMAAFELLTGKSMPGFLPFDSKGDKKLYPERYRKAKITDEQIDNFNKPNHIATVSTSNKPNLKVMTPSSEEGVLVSCHAYTVVRSDSKYVYLINPWDTSLEIPIDRETFKEFFNQIQEMDL